MNRKSLFISVLIIVTLLLALAGCGNSNNGDGTQETVKPEENNQTVEASTKATKEKKPDKNKESKSLLVYSGAGLRKPMDEVGQVFEQKFGVKIEYSYAGSAQNLSQIELVQKGDAYIPGAKHYIDSAIEKGFVKSSKDVVYHIPTIGVPKGNPANIQCLKDLAKPGIKVVLGDERAAAIGKVAQKLLKNNNILEQVEENVVSKDATVNEVLVHVAMKQADACIIWEDNVVGVEEVEIIKIDKEENLIKTIPIGSLTFSEKPELAQKFVDFVASVEGKAIFKKHGFEPVE